MNELEDIIQMLKKFRDDRDWKQFHNPKDLSIALSIESSELAQEYLWKDAESANVDKVKDELADVFSYALYIADYYNLDIKQIIKEKIEKNEVKYPVDKSKGNAKKYNELG